MTLQIAVNKFIQSSFKYEWYPIGFIISSFLQQNPNGHYSYLPIPWLFSIPVFETKLMEIPLNDFTRQSEPLDLKVEQSTLFLYDVPLFAPFFDLMSTTYRYLTFNKSWNRNGDGDIRNRDNIIGRIRLILGENDYQTTRVCMSLPIVMILAVGFGLAVYFVLFLIIVPIGYFLNGCQTQ